MVSPAHVPTITAGPITEPPNLPNWNEATVCPSKSKLEGILQEYYRRNPSAIVMAFVRLSVH